MHIINDYVKQRDTVDIKIIQTLATVRVRKFIPKADYDLANIYLINL